MESTTIWKCKSSGHIYNIIIHANHIPLCIATSTSNINPSHTACCRLTGDTFAHNIHNKCLCVCVFELEHVQHTFHTRFLQPLWWIPRRGGSQYRINPFLHKTSHCSRQISLLKRGTRFGHVVVFILFSGVMCAIPEALGVCKSCVIR